MFSTDAGRLFPELYAEALPEPVPCVEGLDLEIFRFKKKKTFGRLHLKQSGVYIITCRANGGFYVGSTTDFSYRRGKHLSELRHNKHHSPQLQRAFNCHGEESIEITFLVATEVSDLQEQEQHWIRQLDAIRFGYNTTLFAYAPMRGRKISAEAKEKSRLTRARRAAEGYDYGASNRGVPLPPERRALFVEGARQAGRRKRLTQAQKDHLRAIQVGKTRPVAAHVIAAANAARRSRKPFVLLDPTGAKVTFTNLAKFCRENGLCDKSLRDVHKGRAEQHRGWTRDPSEALIPFPPQLAQAA